MPGPSLSYSAFSNKLQDALEIVKSDRMATVVVERLDESLVVASHYLGRRSLHCLLSVCAHSVCV